MFALTIGLIIGLVLGLTGAGGSVFAMPLLVMALGVSVQTAAGVSLGAVFVSALLGVLLRLRSNDIQWLPALVFASFGALTAPLGGYVASQVDSWLIILTFSLLVLVIAARMFYQALRAPEQAAVLRATSGGTVHSGPAVCGESALTLGNFRFACFIRLTGAALVTGLLSGFFGVGGGFLIVPVLMSLLRLDIRQAVGTSLFVISTVSASGFLGFISQNELDMDMFQSVAAGALGGMVIGMLLSRRLAGPVMQKFFAVMMVVLALVMLLRLS